MNAQPHPYRRAEDDDARPPSSGPRTGSKHSSTSSQSNSTRSTASFNIAHKPSKWAPLRAVASVAARAARGRTSRTHSAGGIPMPLSPTNRGTSMTFDSGHSGHSADGRGSSQQDLHGSSFANLGGTIGRQGGSALGLDSIGPGSVMSPTTTRKYGTFAPKRGSQAPVIRLLPDDDVRIIYYNSDGRTGATLESVTDDADRARFASSRSLHHDDSVAVEPEIACSDDGGSDVGAGPPRPSTEGYGMDLSYDWMWVDVVGRDEASDREQYDRAIRRLTQEFDICPSLLVDQDLNLMLPQIFDAATKRAQYLVVLRVAFPKVNLKSDSILSLTNRWLLFIDLDRKLLVSLHRVDTESMAALRANWAALMQSRTISFEEFLIKIIDDSVATYAVALDVNHTLLDICESHLCDSLDQTGSEDSSSALLFGGSSKHCLEGQWTHRITKAEIMAVFEGSERSTFMRKLLSSAGASARAKITRGEMNSFLYHLHRRASVQARMLNLTQKVLGNLFLEFRLCSEDRSQQMCSGCNDLTLKATDLRDNAEHLLNLHLSLISFKTNELMAILTKFSVVFVPLTFIAGVYGMNFDYMPELHYRQGYAMVWTAMFVVAASIYVYFRRHGLLD